MSESCLLSKTGSCSLRDGAFKSQQSGMEQGNILEQSEKAGGPSGQFVSLDSLGVARVNALPGAFISIRNR